MTPLNIRQQLLLTTLLPAALIALITIGFYTWSGLQTLSSEQRERGLSTVRFIAPVSEFNLLTGQVEFLQSLVDSTVSEHGVKAAMILNAKGRPLAVSGHISLASEQYRDFTSTAAVLAEGKEWIAFGAPVTRTVAPADPLFDDGGGLSRPEDAVVGYVVVELDRAAIIHKQQALLQQSIVLVFLSLLLIGLLAVRVADRFGAPLVRLSVALDALRQGQLAHRIPAGRGGQLEGLEQAFNAAASDLGKRIQNLEAERDTLHEELALHRDHDPATGLLNQTGFFTRLAEQLGEDRIGHYPYALIWLRLENISGVADAQGLSTAEQLLHQMGERLQRELDRHDLLGHIGHGEFVVLLRNTPEALARQRAADWLTLIADFRFTHQGQIYNNDAAIGLLCLRDPEADAQAVMVRGREIAVAAGKLTGKKMIVEELHTPPLLPTLR